MKSILHYLSTHSFRLHYQIRNLCWLDSSKKQVPRWNESCRRFLGRNTCEELREEAAGIMGRVFRPWCRSDTWERRGDKKKDRVIGRSDWSTPLRKSKPDRLGVLKQRLPVRGVPCWAEMAALSHQLREAREELRPGSVKTGADSKGAAAGDYGWTTLFAGGSYESWFEQHTVTASIKLSKSKIIGIIIYT